MDAPEALLLQRALEPLQGGVAPILLDHEQVHAGLVAGLDHAHAVLPARGHRLFGHHMHALPGGGDGLSIVPDAGQQVANHPYFPILVGDDYPLGRDALYDKLKANGINGRRYFYPLISDFPMYRGLPSA